MAEVHEEPAQSSNPFPQYPEPLVVLPHEGHEHLHTFIVLHGRGSNGEEFGSLLVLRDIPKYNNLLQAFPNAKFIFPTAAREIAKTYGRKLGRQWFDYGSLKAPTQNEGLQVEGLRETSGYIHHLLKQEIELIGAKNTVLWGLSQGCAASLVASVLWDGEPFAAVIGMCGWLPFRKRLEDKALSADESQLDDEGLSRSVDEQAMDKSSIRDGGMVTTTSKPLVAIEWLEQQLELEHRETSSLPITNIPIFLRHGVEDGNVFVHLGREAAACLKTLQVKVDYGEYDDLGHWYSGEMLYDIIEFLQETCGWRKA